MTPPGYFTIRSTSYRVQFSLPRSFCVGGGNERARRDQSAALDESPIPSDSHVGVSGSRTMMKAKDAHPHFYRLAGAKRPFMRNAGPRSIDRRVRGSDKPITNGSSFISPACATSKTD